MQKQIQRWVIKCASSHLMIYMFSLFRNIQPNDQCYWSHFHLLAMKAHWIVENKLKNWLKRCFPWGENLLSLVMDVEICVELCQPSGGKTLAYWPTCTVVVAVTVVVPWWGKFQLRFTIYYVSSFFCIFLYCGPWYWR